MTLAGEVRSPVNTRLPNIIRNLPVLFLLGDICGLFICLAIAFWLRFHKPVDWINPLPYGFVCMVLAALYLADTYHPDRQIAGLRTPARIIVCNIAIAFLISGLIYLFNIGKYNPLSWRSVLLPSLAIFTIWAVMLRLVAFSSSKVGAIAFS
jgi:uncharacterized membrane protein YidH (DUF202 family)